MSVCHAPSVARKPSPTIRSNAAARYIRVLVTAVSLITWQSISFAQSDRANENKYAAAPRADTVSTQQVRADLYMLTVDGSNLAVQVGPDGAIVVDTGPPGHADALLAAIRRVTDQPIRFIIDTSADARRVGNNAELSKAGLTLGQGMGARVAIGESASAAPIIAHENVLNTMIGVAAGSVNSYPGEALPIETYNRHEKNFYMNGQAVEILWQPGAHSDGDSVVLFRRDDVVATGDVLDLTRFPVIDVNNGGSVSGEIDALNRLLDLVIPATPLAWREDGTVVVPARGRLCEQAEVVQYRDMMVIIRDRIQDLINQGKTLEQVKAARPTAGYNSRYGSSSGEWTTEMFVEAVYKSLTAGEK